MKILAFTVLFTLAVIVCFKRGELFAVTEDFHQSIMNLAVKKIHGIEATSLIVFTHQSIDRSDEGKEYLSKIKASFMSEARLMLKKLFQVVECIEQTENSTVTSSLTCFKQ